MGNNALVVINIPIKLHKPLTILCGCTPRFVSDLVGNPEYWFSHNEDHMSAISSTRRLSNIVLLVNLVTVYFFIKQNIITKCCTIIRALT